MFELEREIAGWKNAIASDGKISVDERLELESHLRESIVALRSQSLSEQESFWIATARLGHPTALEEEFAKNDSARRWKYRVFWMLVGSLGLKAVGGAAASVTAIIGTAMAASGFAGWVTGIAMMFATFTLWIYAFVTVFRGRQQLGRTAERLPLRWIVALAATLLVAPVISRIGVIAQSRLVPPRWLGEVASYMSVGGLALNFCIVAFCLAILWKLGDRDALTLN